jgi:serine/threonine protein kinase
MAPEQLRGRPCAASDQYSLGIVVYEWLCGIPPFTGSSSLEIAMKHISEPPQPLRAIVPSVSPTVEQVVMKAIAKDVEQRFESVQAFAVTLEQASLLDRSDIFASSSSTEQTLSESSLSGSPDDTQPMVT